MRMDNLSCSFIIQIVCSVKHVRSKHLSIILIGNLPNMVVVPIILICDQELCIVENKAKKNMKSERITRETTVQSKMKRGKGERDSRLKNTTLVLLANNTSLTRTQYSFFVEVASSNDLEHKKRVLGIYLTNSILCHAFLVRNVKHGFMNVGIESISFLTVLNHE